MYTLLLLKISTTSCFLKLLPTQCQTWQHSMSEYFKQNSDSASKILQEAFNCHNLLDTRNFLLQLNSPAHIHFYFIAAIDVVISAAFGFREFHIWKFDLEPQNSQDICSKLNLMQRNIVHKLLILSIDLILILSDFQNYWLPDGDQKTFQTNCGGSRISFSNSK